MDKLVDKVYFGNCDVLNCPNKSFAETGPSDLDYVPRFCRDHLAVLKNQIQKFLDENP